MVTRAQWRSAAAVSVSHLQRERRAPQRPDGLLPEARPSSYSNNPGLEDRTAETHTTINPSRHEYVCGLIYVLSIIIYIYLIRPHEANEEDDGKAHSDDIDPPEPRSLHRRHQQLFNHSGLQEDRVKYRRRFSFLECLSEAYLLLSISSHLPSLDGFIWTCQ